MVTKHQLQHGIAHDLLNSVVQFLYDEMLIVNEWCSTTLQEICYVMLKDNSKEVF